MSVEWTLTLKKGPRVVQTFTYSDQERVLIGRNEDCDVQVEGDSASRHHCEIVLAEGFHRLSDLGSSHGTFVNGRRVSDYGLNSGDEVTVGAYNLTYEATFSEPAAGAKPAARPGMGGTIEIVAPEGQGLGGPAVAKARGYLTLVEGGRTQNVILKNATTVLGRVATADVHVGGLWSPRIAALILRERFAFRILDTSRRGNCVRVNGKPTREAELKSGDELRVYTRVLRFQRGLPGVGPDDATVERRDVAKG